VEIIKALLTRQLQSICDVWSYKSTCCFCQDQVSKCANNLPSVQTLRMLRKLGVWDKCLQIKIPILVGIFSSIPGKLVSKIPYGPMLCWNPSFGIIWARNFLEALRSLELHGIHLRVEQIKSIH